MHRIIEVFEKITIFNYIYGTVTPFNIFELLFIMLMTIQKEAFPFFQGVGASSRFPELLW